MACMTSIHTCHFSFHTIVQKSLCCTGFISYLCTRKQHHVVIKPQTHLLSNQNYYETIIHKTPALAQKPAPQNHLSPHFHRCGSDCHYHFFEQHLLVCLQATQRQNPRRRDWQQQTPLQTWRIHLQPRNGQDPYRQYRLATCRIRRHDWHSGQEQTPCLHQS